MPGTTDRGGRKAKMGRRTRVIGAGMVVAILLLGSVPLTASEEPQPASISSTYGVNDELAALQAEKALRINPPEVVREAAAVLDNMQPHRVERTGPASDYSLVDPVLPDMSPPEFFDEAENNTALNGTSIIQWLLQGPLNYWVQVRTGNLTTWTQGSLRPTINFSIDASGGVHFVNWGHWVYVDADNNASTGDAGGLELQARLSLAMENTSFERPHLFGDRGWSYDFSGGLQLEVARLAPAGTELPMTVSFFKSFMYRGYDYIWVTSFEYSDLPFLFETRILAEKVKVGGSLVDLLGDLLNNFTLGNTSLLKELSGPYKAQINVTPPIGALAGTVGYAKVVAGSLEERSYIHFRMTPSAGRTTVPSRMEIWLDSPSFNTSFNRARWTADSSCRLDVALSSTQDNTTYATLSIQDMPTYLFIRIDEIATGENPQNSLNFEASSSIGLFVYDEFELFGNNATSYRHMHASIRDMPTELSLSGTFEAGGPQPPPITNPIGIGIIPRLLDNLMTRFANKFYTFARTLRSIPENALHMSEKGGWLKLEMPEGQSIGSLGLRLTSGPYIQREGSFMAFYNLSLPGGDDPRLGISFSMNISKLAGLDTDFRHGTRLELRTSAPQSLLALFIDRSRDANASLEFSNLPARFSLDIDKDTSTLTLGASDRIGSLTYVGWVRQQFLRMDFSDLPTGFKVTQKPDRFTLDTSPGETMGRMEILSADSELYSLDGNYLLVRSGSWGTSFGAALEGLSHAGYTTGQDAKLELCLTSPKPLGIYISNESQGLKARLSISPVPASLSVGMSGLLASGGVKVPDLLKATSVLGFSSAVFAVTELGADVLAIASQMAAIVDEQMAGIGANSNFGVNTTTDTLLVADVQKGNITEAPWTHGITTRHVEVPAKNQSYYNTKMFLRLARQTLLSSRSQGDTMNFSIDMKGFRPRYDWMLVDMEGVNGRDITAYMTGIGSPVDFRLDANITQNATYGRDTLRADLVFRSTSAFGPFLTSLERQAPDNTRVLAYASSLPPELALDAYLAGRLDLSFKASEDIRALYVKNSRLVDGNWRSSTVLAHDIPRTMEAALSPPAEFESSAGPAQMLPELTVSAERDTLDLYAVLDGRATGQRSSYQVEVKNAGKLTTGRRDGDVYRLRGNGADEIYVRVWDMPYKKGMSITSLGLFVEDLRSLDVKISMVFGTYPMFQLSSVSAGSIHLSVRTRLSMMGMEKEGKLVFADYRSAGGLPAGLQFFSNGMSAGASDGEEHLLVPMPMLSLLGTLVGG